MHTSGGSAFLFVLFIVAATFIVRAVLRAHAAKMRPTVEEPRPSEIMAAIKQAPVLEQARAARAYVGLKVRWQVTLQSAIPLSPISVRLMLLDRGDFPWVLCDVRKHRYPQLSGLVQYASFWVTGQISRMEGDEISLKNVTLEFDH